jgi:hypothetical protein
LHKRKEKNMSLHIEDDIQQIPILEKMRPSPPADIEVSQQTRGELKREELQEVVGGNIMQNPAAIVGISTVGGSMFGQGVGGATGAVADLASGKDGNKYTIKYSQYGAAAGIPLGLAIGIKEAKNTAKQAAQTAGGVAKTASMAR